MKVAHLINLLEKHNLQAEIIFRLSEHPSICVGSKYNCKCTEKDIILTIGKEYIQNEVSKNV